MAATDSRKLFDLVEERTGFRVQVGTTSSNSADAEMIVAGPEHPVHIINITETKTSVADYVVAAQCAMILLMWSSERGIPKFRPIGEKVVCLTAKAIQWKGLAKLPRNLAQSTATMMIQGLLHQLRSQPSELYVIDFLHREYPGLREQQTVSVEETLRRSSESFRPEIRDIAPPDIFAKNAAMNAALAHHWSQLSGSRTATIPYASMGFLAEGEKLHSLFAGASGNASDRCQSVVDLWAEHLKLRTVYEWEYRPR